MARIAINGLGRIGRAALRVVEEAGGAEVVASTTWSRRTTWPTCCGTTPSTGAGTRPSRRPVTRWSSAGDVLAVIETDKAAMDMEAYDEGVLTKILVKEGASVPIGTPIAVIGDQAAATGISAPSPVPAPDETERAVVPPPGPAPAGAVPAARARTSPLARKLAREHGIDLATVSGSGPGARIVRADIEDAIRKHGGAQPAPAPAQGLQPVTPVAAGPAAPAPATSSAPIAPAALSAVDAEADEIPLSTVRRLTAERLAASAREAPHLYLTVVADAGELLAFRAQLDERRVANVKVSVTDLLTKACAVALAAHPEINVSWDQTRILRRRRVNIGVAVAIEDGLIVPVIRDADHKTLTEISREARDLTVRARARRLTADELSGGTFTVSNLGMYGIRQFTAVINPPQAAILAIGEAVRQPVVRGTRSPWAPPWR